MADEAWILGLKAWKELEQVDDKEAGERIERKTELCPWISMSREDLLKGGGLMFIPCGLAAGSSITVVGTPHHAHMEYAPVQSRSRSTGKGDGLVLVSVSQFVVELLGLRSVEGEDHPKILHLNPRLRGDRSRRPVIEHNTCYRMHWGTSQRCDGLPSEDTEEMLGFGLKMVS
ncbi:Hydroxyproline O-galactosyltransferase [Vigna angularis]|uniref:Galectin n=1 Tax=Phaseolus angularis TaxID=3914 RepID=A0A8T0KBJ0_PHAAN|nr:Hydroxyproline O-galactosyltransferase [Vigna angularis]